MKGAVLVVLAGLAACGDNIVPGEEPLPPGPDGWAIEVDMSGLDRFVQAGTATWRVGGHARSALPLADTADVAMLAVPLVGGDFEHPEVSIAPEGMTVVPIHVRDVEGHERRAHRTLLAAHFLPEGEVNDRIMTLTLSDQLLAAINQQIRQQAGDVDLAAQLEGQEYDNGDCTIVMTSVTHGPVVLELVKRQQTQLWFHFRLPNLLVHFDGECRDPTTLAPIGVHGRIGGTIDVWSQLTATPPVAPAFCVSSFGHSTPEVTIANWIYEIEGDNPATTVLIRTLAPSSDEAKAETIAAIRDGADQGLTEGLSDLDVLTQTQTLELVAGKPIELTTCLAALGPEHGSLVLRLAGTVTGTTPSPAPGAPLRAPQAPISVDNEFLLDTGLMSQLTFAGWKDGLFTVAQPQAFDLSLLGLLVPGLVDRFPDVEKADIEVVGELPPYFTAVPDGVDGDMRVEIGDLMVYVSADGEQILKIGLHLVIDLDFVAQDGELVPTVVNSTAEAVVLDELLDANDDAIELAIEAGIASNLDGVLGGGGAGGGGGIPEIIPGLGRITDIRPDAGGRYLRVSFIPGANAAFFARRRR